MMSLMHFIGGMVITMSVLTPVAVVLLGILDNLGLIFPRTEGHYK